MLRNIFLIAIPICLLASCSSKKNLMYFYDLKDSTSFSAPINNEIQLKIERDDRLEVRITTMNEQINAFLSSGTVGGGGGNESSNLYTVNNDGSINLPMVGAIKVEGLTKEEAKNKITSEISKYVKDPIVNVKLEGFKYTVWGMGVASGKVLYSNSEKLNVIEALVSAGDIKNGAELNKVMLIREENGMRNMVRLDLGDSRLLSSPYFYLKQNDMIYVEPKSWVEGAEQRNMRMIRLGTATFGILNTLVSTYLLIDKLTEK